MIHRLRLDIADWWWRTRNDPYARDMFLGLAAIAAALMFVVIVAGNVTNEERCQIVAASSPAATAPASPTLSGSQAGAPSHCEEMP